MSWIRIRTGISPNGSGSDFYNTNPDPRIQITGVKPADLLDELLILIAGRWSWGCGDLLWLWLDRQHLLNIVILRWGRWQRDSRVATRSLHWRPHPAVRRWPGLGRGPRGFWGGGGGRGRGRGRGFVAATTAVLATTGLAVLILCKTYKNKA